MTNQWFAKDLLKTDEGVLVRAVEATPVIEEPLEEVVEDQPLDLSTLKNSQSYELYVLEQGLDAKGKKSELIAKLSNSGDGENDEDSE